MGKEDKVSQEGNQGPVESRRLQAGSPGVAVGTDLGLNQV